MNILVCLKQIPDPEIPARDFRIDAERREMERDGANLVTNIFCENALETALQLRERVGDARITVLSYGQPSAEDSLRKALAMKADAAALVTNEGNPNPDPLAVARVLAAAIRKLGAFDLVMTGREAGDWGAGQTGALVAEELGLPCVSFVDSIEAAGARLLRLKRQTDTGWEVVEAEPPVVVTVTNDEHNVPRIPKVRDVMMSYRQPLTKWTLAELGIDADEARAGNSYYEVAELFIPQKETRCEFVTGDTLDEKVEAFARRLVEVTRAL
ncbi:MAG TPA: electron transfer flavoprotein subunit beta/FixA family protein [Pyrinomonadaceae bacterium]|jgi:electron transfer flavoprotein beta subunit|nr:electron transfer flavoprotein subunit beta/FixA family protein [Pyrinomonadaceae bacterium]